MKQQLLLTLLLIANLSSFAQSTARTLHKSLVKINDTLYAGETEITNKQYTEFVSYLRANGPKSQLAIALIDSAQWKNKLTYNAPYVEYYHSHPAYAGYPVVNVSHEGAKLYCEWLTARYNADPAKKFDKVQFRLPTESEWEMMAGGGDTSAVYAWKGDQLRNRKGQMMANFKRGDGDSMGVAGHLNDNADITAPSYSYWPNRFGLYNMSGNVAEMVSDKGIVKGGSWRETSDMLKIKSRQTNDGSPRANTGFRYVMVVIKK